MRGTLSGCFSCRGGGIGSGGVGVAFELAPNCCAVAVGHGCNLGVGTVLALQAGNGRTFFVGQVLLGHLCLDSILNEEIKAVHQALIHPIPIRCSSVLNPSTDTSEGTIRDLTPFFDNYGNWSFTLSVSGRNTFSDRIVISTFEDLTDFSTREITLMPTASIVGIPITPYTIEGDLQWDLSAGSFFTGNLVGYSWSARDGGMFNPSLDSGTVENFVNFVPEPTCIFITSVGIALSLLYRTKDSQLES